MADVPVDLPPSYESTGYRRIMDYLGAQLRGRLVLRFASPFRASDVPASTTSPAHTLVELGPVASTWMTTATQSSSYAAAYGELVPVNAVGGEVHVTLPVITAGDAGRRVGVTLYPSTPGNPVKLIPSAGQLIKDDEPNLPLSDGAFFAAVVVAIWEGSVGRWGVESISITP